MSHMLTEIRSQAEAWASALAVVNAEEAALRELLRKNAGREVRFLGSGSSYYLGLAAAPAWSRRGWRTRVLPNAEQLLHADLYPAAEPSLALAVSRSGATSEAVKALTALKAKGSAAIVITTEKTSSLAALADVLLTVAGGRERATVQTRSFSGQLVAALALTQLAAGLEPFSKLPELAPSWLSKAETTVKPLAHEFQRAYFLGTGACWGLAQEGALKLKEASLTEAEAFETLEFRHGPQSMVDSETLIVGLVSTGSTEAELAVLREMRKLGAKVLAVGEAIEAGGNLTPLSFHSSLPAEVSLPLYLAPLQLLAYYRGVAKRLTPDHPRNLSFAVELKEV